MADYLRRVIDRLSAEDQADLASYMAASTEADRDEAEFRADPSTLLPSGMRFEWGLPDAP